MALDIAPPIAPRSYSAPKDYITAEKDYGASNYKPLDVVLSRGEGVYVWDVEGNRYLDCLAGYSAINQGHCHPKIRDAMIAQASRLTLTSRAFRNDQLGPFCEELCTLTQSTKALPMNTGAEAVESAIKVARKWGYQVKGVPEGQAEIIVFANNFHGRTVSVVSFSTDPMARKGFGPFTSGFNIVRFGDLNALEEAVTPNTVARPHGADPGRGRRDHAAAGLRERGPRALHARTHHPDPRRSPDGAGPHRQAPG